jgi:riboflavin kinase/FMN adenylyltransferase
MMKKLVEHSKKFDLIPTAITFEKPYEAIIEPENFDGLITTSEERIQLMKMIGIEDVIIQDLKEISHMNEIEYIEMLLKEFNMKSIYVGYDFRFGKRAKGDTQLLKEVGTSKGFTVEIIPKIIEDGKRISSSLIRKALKDGMPEIAAHYLGRSFEIYGKVVRERGIGSAIGFPTANISRNNKDLIVPKYGVYLVTSNVNGEELYGVMNIGVRPTTDEDGDVTYEVHFLDKQIDLLGTFLNVKLVKYMRGELKFSNLSDLKMAIQKDVNDAKKMIKERKIYA